MKLREILPADVEFDERHSDIDIGGLTADSRTVKRGDAFVAVAGGKADGLRFVDTAIAAGASAIVAERAPQSPLPPTVAFVRAGNVRRALAQMAAKFYPRQPGVIAAVTGTSGKTWSRPLPGKSGARSASAPRASARSASYHRAATLHENHNGANIYVAANPLHFGSQKGSAPKSPSLLYATYI